MLRASWTAFCYWALCFWPFLVVGEGAAWCTMQVVPDKHVTSSTSTSAEMEASVDACQTFCKWVSQCQAITYHNTTSICIIHTSTVTVTWDIKNNTFSRKSDCDDKKACCFDTDMGKGVSTYNLLLDLNNNTRLQSCKAMCEATTSCTAVTFVNNKCSIYNATSFQTETQSGSFYYSNSCPGGSLTIVYTCSSSS